MMRLLVVCGAVSCGRCVEPRFDWLEYDWNFCPFTKTERKQ